MLATTEAYLPPKPTFILDLFASEREVDYVVDISQFDADVSLAIQLKEFA